MTTAAQPLVSAIIPNFNKAPYLRESVDSALSQTYKNIEILIVDDGSTDDSRAIAASIVKASNGKVQLLEKQNGGISDARNFGIARANGQYILCLDGDDIVAPTFVEKAMNLIMTEGANLVCCDVQLFGADDSIWEPPYYDQYGIRYNNDIPTLVLYEKRFWHLTGGYKKALPFNEDWEFFINASRYNLQPKKILERLFKYRVLPEGLAQNYIKDSWNRSVSLMITANSDLYPVEQVLLAHENLSKMPQNWIDKFTAQDKLHSTEWLLKFWLGLAKEPTSPNGALRFYAAANELENHSNWQPLYRIGCRVAPEHGAEAATLFHGVRLLRPDMERIVRDRIKVN